MGMLLDLQLNERAYLVSVVATIFVPLTFVTGFFGMNFGWMVDHIDSPIAFWVLGIAVPVATAALSWRLLVRRFSGRRRPGGAERLMLAPRLRASTSRARSSAARTSRVDVDRRGSSRDGPAERVERRLEHFRVGSAISAMTSVMPGSRLRLISSSASSRSPRAGSARGAPGSPRSAARRGPRADRRGRRAACRRCRPAAGSGPRRRGRRPGVSIPPWPDRWTSVAPRTCSRRSRSSRSSSWRARRAPPEVGEAQGDDGVFHCRSSAQLALPAGAARRAAVVELGLQLRRASR